MEWKAVWQLEAGANNNQRIAERIFIGCLNVDSILYSNIYAVSLRINYRLYTSARCAH